MLHVLHYLWVCIPKLLKLQCTLRLVHSFLWKPWPIDIDDKHDDLPIKHNMVIVVPVRYTLVISLCSAVDVLVPAAVASIKKGLCQGEFVGNVGNYGVFRCFYRCFCKVGILLAFLCPLDIQHGPALLENLDI